MDQDNVSDIDEMPNICLVIFMIKGALQWMHHFISREEAFPTDFTRAQVF